MADLLAFGNGLARTALVAVRSFVGTLAVLTAAGVALAAVSYYFLRDHPVYALLAAALAVVEGVATGVVLGAKRALVMALAHALGALRLGRALVRLVFDRLLGVAEGRAPGERGRRVARGIERLPLAQAEQLLARAVRLTAGEADAAGWWRRAIGARLLSLVQKYTLARFREEGARHGGVDLFKVREELEQQIDESLVEKVRGGLRLWTVLAIVGLPGAVAVQTYLALALLK
jgi:hypothetical protein